MKFLSAIILIFCLQAQARTSAQRITLHFEAAPLKNIFQEITEQTGILFLYTEDLLKECSAVSIKMENATLEAVLKKCFADQPLSFSIVNKTVVITRKVALKVRDTLRNIIGTVTSDGKPLSGVSVFIKQSGKGTITDMQGKYRLTGVPDNAVLLFSSIGYENKEIASVMQQEINADLATAANLLDQTVIIGYGTSSRRYNTGAISKVSSQQIAAQPVSDPILALHGKVPGLYIQQASGIPGTSINVQIRGQNSIAASSRPFYVIDGVPFHASSMSVFLPGATETEVSPFSFLDPSIIESIEVLKDADATAIYGSRGANGVILITTKNGKPGRSRFTVNISQGASDLHKRIKLLNTQQYLEMRNRAFANDNAVPQFFDYDINGSWDTTRNTDWQETLLGNSASITDANISLQGGSDLFTYATGASYQNQGTIILGNFKQEKISGNMRMNIQSANHKFKAGISFNYNSLTSNLPQYNPLYFITLPPTAPALFDSSGKLNWQGDTWNNPAAYLNQRHKSITENLLVNLELSYSLLPNLILKTTGGFSHTNFSEKILSPKSMYNPIYESIVEHESSFSENKYKTFIIEPQINYHIKAGGYPLDILLGGSLQQNHQNVSALKATGFPSPSLMENKQAAAATSVIGENDLLYRYISAFARVGYKIKDKYLFNLTGRRDGSSRFGPGKQFSDFYSIGSGWIFTNEQLFDRLTWLSFGKIRASYGTAGNDGIPDYGFLNTYQPSNSRYLGVTGLSPVRLANPLFAWEINKKSEIALEIGLIKDRVFITANYYSNISSNQLVNIPLPGSTGFTTILGNLPAKVRNRGIELDISSTNIRHKNFSWSSSFNISFPKNVLLNYPNLEGSAYANRYIIGKSLYVQKQYHFTGINDTTGQFSFQDVNKDGIISSPVDLQGLKERTQQFFGGLENVVVYKNFTLTVFFQFVKQTGFNYLNGFFQAPGIGVNQPVFMLNDYAEQERRFTQNFFSATATNYSRLQQSDERISDASFIRLKTASVSYNLPPNIISRIKMQQGRIYVNAQNLWTLTSYKGWDPENQGQIPPLRTIIAGIQLTF